MYIVGFNGPPRSGKDTLAQMLQDHLNPRALIPSKLDSLSMPLRKIAYAMVDYSGELDGPDYETFKTTRFGLLKRTGRELLIDVSERFLKPAYGSGVMADLMLERNANFTGIVMIRDSGFQCEVDPIIGAVGAANFYLVRVHRKGCDFSNDSREWCLHKYSADIDNNGTLEDLRTEAGRIYGRLVNKMGWHL
jgi:hypothetical protein